MDTVRQTDKTLLEQMQISEFELEQRKGLFGLDDKDIQALRAAKPIIESELESLVDEFYTMQTANPDIALLIGDSDTLTRLRYAQHRYIIDLFSGVYDLEYVNNRLRIGLVHKRIGVEPKLYLSAIYTLKTLLNNVLQSRIANELDRHKTVKALEKLLLYDITLVFDTYIRSLVSEIETSRLRSEVYASDLETRVRKRTLELEELSRTDPLTGLYNVRHLLDMLTASLRAAQRRGEVISLVYIDVNDFKRINDEEGHRRGDEVLRIIGATMRAVSRAEDSCFRYGGDEFCVILPNCARDTAKELYVNRLTQEIHKQLPGVTLSVGITDTGPTNYLDPETLIHSADKNMYIEKNQTRTVTAITPLISKPGNRKE